MVDFDLGKQYDAVTCLFSSIGYTETVERLNRAVKQIARHLLIGGVTVIEPWFTPDQYESRRVHAALCRSAGFEDRAHERQSILKWRFLSSISII